MQRVTKYPLLLKAIHSKTLEEDSRDQIVRMVSAFFMGVVWGFLAPSGSLWFPSFHYSEREKERKTKQKTRLCVERLVHNIQGFSQIS